MPPMTRLRTSLPAARMVSAALSVALCVALFIGLAPGATAGSLKWQSSNPDAPRPGPARPPASAQQAEPAIEPGAASSGGVEPSDPGITRSGDYLARMDTDRNGKVSLIEYQVWLSYAFDRMDANRDGVLTPEEQPGGRGGVLTLEAHRARVAETFRRQDSNSDGSLDARELAAPPQAPGR